ncbi:transglutaminase-like domain-containing protein [Compostimonas suwonensis]|uniref:Transglutaminase superfamily protein n=1 Tax=Compostimonas suwonensis TaxID=1048394 RepID=A0A2M9BUF7_9MICO|nr:transglutaminase-like domain-containing protein [Compostimonas suwonensis]PJJ61563.1 transglutaminase superfamily protein [Compostimonas suwonensis]
MPVGFVIANALATLLAVAVSSSTLWPIYRDGSFLVLVAVAAVVGVVIAILGAVFRWPSYLVVVVSVLAYLVMGVPLAIPSEAVAGVLPTPGGILDLLAATALGWKQLVTISVPVGDYQALLVPALVVVFGASVVSLTIALRSRYRELAAVPPVVVFLVGIAFGPQSVLAPVLQGLALLVVLLGWVVALRWQRRAAAIRRLAEQSTSPLTDRRTGGARTAVGAVLVVAVAVVAGAGATVAVATTTERDVVRSHVEQPFDPRAYPSPLAGFRSYLQAERSTEPMLTVAGLPEGGRLRIATMDSYDGIVYAVGGGDPQSDSGSFARVPYQLDQSALSGEQAQIEVTVDAYSGVWVPGIGQLEQIEFQGPRAERLGDAFYYNDLTGTGVVVGGLAAGDAYSARSIVLPAVGADGAGSLEPGDAVLPALGEVPDELATVLDDVTAGQQTPGGKLAAALAFLASDGYISHGVAENEPASRSGHSVDRLRQLLTEVPMLGDQEQYAVLAAIMARKLGFPARVVIGFDPSSPAVARADAAASASDGGPVTLTGADISAWIEVQDSARGWVTIDPNPALRDIPEKQPDEATQVARPQSVVDPPPEETNREQDDTPPRNSEEDPPPAPDTFLAILLAVLTIGGWSLLALAILVSPFLAVIIAKVRRRRLRRTVDDPVGRIDGAWREFADAAVDHGFEPPPSATRSEIAATVGGMRPLVLASVSDRADFSPDATSDHDASQVWLAVDELRRWLGAHKTRWQRLRALVSLRSLGGYSGRSGTSTGRSTATGRKTGRRR